jgi:hypothetical protein
MQLPTGPQYMHENKAKFIRSYFIMPNEDAIFFWHSQKDNSQVSSKNWIESGEKLTKRNEGNNI